MTDDEYNSKLNHQNALINCPDLKNMTELLESNAFNNNIAHETIEQLQNKIKINNNNINRLKKE